MKQIPVIVPLDVPSFDEAVDLITRLPKVTYWKVGLQLFVAAGPRILEMLLSQNKKVFLDLKFHDIPNTVHGACAAAQKYGVEFLSVHSSAGGVALKAAVEGVSPPTKLLAISLLTSLNSRELAFELKVPLELPEYVLHLAQLAQESGLPGAVCSPQEAPILRRVCGPDFLLVCPGVRPEWAAKGDQRRTLTPSQALQAGANYLVIGRPITQAPDPALAWDKIVQELTAD